MREEEGGGGGGGEGEREGERSIRYGANSCEEI
jgi:hypothetical protein